MTIKWPSGNSQVFQNIPTNTVVKVTEDNEEPIISKLERWGNERESLPIGQATLSIPFRHLKDHKPRYRLQKKE